MGAYSGHGHIQSRSLSRRSVFRTAGGLAAAGFVAACGGTAASGQSGSTTTTNGKKLRNITLTYGVPSLDPTTAWFAAIPQAIGFYAQQGLNVNVEGLSGGSAAVAALVAGRAQFATQSSEIIFTSVDTGIALKGFMCEIPGDFVGLAVNESSPVTTEAELADYLRGKTIGTNAIGGDPELEIKGVLQALGLNPNTDVQFLAVGTGTPAANALKTGRVAALGLWAMIYADFQAQGYKMRIFQPQPLPSLGFEHTTVTMQSTIDDDPELVGGFSRAIAQSLAFLYGASPEEITKLHYKVYPDTVPQGVSMSTAIDQGVTVLDSLLPYLQLKQHLQPGQLLGDATSAQIKKVAQMLKTSSVIKSVQPASAYFTPQFLAAANDFNRDAIVAQGKAYKA
jgi:NitT/TauT family transport system substrate-binding protein